MSPTYSDDRAAKRRSDLIKEYGDEGRYSRMSSDIIIKLTTPWHFPMSVRSVLGFVNNGWSELKHFSDMDLYDLLALNNFGPKTISFICERLGLDPKVDTSEPPQDLVDRMKTLEKEYGNRQFRRAFFKNFNVID